MRTLGYLIEDLRQASRQLRDHGQTIAGKRGDMWFLHEKGNMARQICLGPNGFHLRIVTENDSGDVVLFKRANVAAELNKIQKQYPNVPLAAASTSAFCLYQAYAIDKAISILSGVQK